MSTRHFVKLEGHRLDLAAFHERLVTWGQVHFRDFPWRHTRDLYRLLMAEFMLLRTRADQVASVYPAFLERYPTVQALASAEREHVREALYPLGLRWRADYVYDAAQILQEEYGGHVPEAREDLLRLPGVSQYIAGAVCCFGLGRPEPLIDTNTVRVSGRLFDLRITDASRRSRRFRDLISALVDSSRPREYNFALLDLAAAVCTKRLAPDCPRCPLLPLCRYGHIRTGGMVSQ